MARHQALQHGATNARVPGKRNSGSKPMLADVMYIRARLGVKFGGQKLKRVAYGACARAPGEVGDLPLY